jgi:hypothetical protein
MLCFSFLSQSIHALQFGVSPGVERCLTEDAQIGDVVIIEFTTRPLLSTTFVSVIDPSSARVYARDFTPNDNDDRVKLAYTSAANGEYRICFAFAANNNPSQAYNHVYGSNVGTDPLQISVELSMRIGGHAGDISSNLPVSSSDSAKKEALKPMEIKLKSLESLVSQVHGELKSLSQRGIKMQATTESTSSRIIFWSVCSTLILIGLKIFECIYLKDFFKQRRISA